MPPAYEEASISLTREALVRCKTAATHYTERCMELAASLTQTTDKACKVAAFVLK